LGDRAIVAPSGENLLKIAFRLSFAVLIALVLTAVPSLLTVGAAKEGLAGQFLVASPKMSDPRFRQTVIFLAEHDENGALGLVVNRRVEKANLRELAEGMPIPEPPEDVATWVYYGGPVEPHYVFVLHSSETLPGKSVELIEGVALSRDVEMLSRIAEGKGPERFLLILGYAGWAPNQLEGELATGAWMVVDVDPALIFSEEPEKVWQAIMDLHTMRL
jgi:putative transcriptional regulator